MLNWNSNTLATWCQELTHWKRPWCWERLKAGGEGEDRGWDGWVASPTQWTWTWANSRRQWRTGTPGVLPSMGSQRAGHDWATKQQQEQPVSTRPLHQDPCFSDAFSWNVLNTEQIKYICVTIINIYVLYDVITPEYHSYGLGRKSNTSPLPSLIQTGVCVPPTNPSSREKATYTSILRIFLF